MTELTIEQKRAIALAKARLRMKGGAGVDAADIAKSGASGLARGTMETAGLPGTFGNLLQSGANMLFDTFMPPLSGEQKDAMRSPFTGASLREAASATTGGATEYEPKTTAGKYAGTIGEFIPGAALFGGANPVNLAKFGVLPGAASEGAGQLTEGTEVEPYARFGAALAAPLAPNLIRRAVTPFPAPKSRMGSVKTLEKEGINLTAGQRTGRKGLMYREAEMGGAAADAFGETQKAQFTKAALRHIGVEADAATPEVMTKAYNAIGGTFDDLAARHSIRSDKDLLNDLLKTKHEYRSSTAPSMRAPIIDDTIADITGEIKNSRTISGEIYKSIRSRLGKFVKRGGDEGVAAKEIQGALDAAMERTLSAKKSPDLGAWRDVRRQYRDFLVIEQAAGGAGKDTVSGLLSPQQLRTASKKIYGLRNYTQGRGGLTNLGRSGAAVMEQLPNSGTPGRLDALLPMGVGGGAGATIGGLIGGPSGAAIGTGIGMVAPPLVGRAMLSRPGRAFLGNQALPLSPLGAGGYMALPPAILAGRPNAR